MTRPKVKVVTARVLRDKFNAGRYQERVDSGELRVRILRQGHPAPAKSRQPFCTRSQILAYREQGGKQLAIVHQYLRPDGKVGGSGRPDPKWLLEKGIIYAVTRPS